MSNNSMFRLKVQYKAVNQATGKDEKNKLEILIQAENYTEAEAVLNKIAKQYQFDKLEPYTYDIIRAKLLANDIYDYHGMVTDSENKLTCGLIQHFFEQSYGLYAVDTVVYGDKEADEKDLKETYYIPALDVSDAMNAAMAILKYYNHDYSECHVPSAKLDNAKYIYLQPYTSEAIFKQANDIF